MNREFLAHRALIGIAAGGAMLEAAVLCLTAPAARSLAPQFTALPPLAVFHDLRWLYGYERSWLGFALLIAALITARSGLNAALIHLAWPVAESGLAMPSLAAVFRSSLALTAFACLLLSPVVTLTFGVALLPFSWPYLATLPVMLLISLPLSHGGIVPSWWRALPPARAAGWLLADFAVLTVASAVTGSLPVADAVPVAGLAGLANARAWFGVTTAVARAAQAAPGGRRTVPRSQRTVPRRPSQRPGQPTPWLPMAPMAAILSVVAVIGMTRLAFIVGRAQHPATTAGHSVQAGPARAGPLLADPARDDPVLEIRGFGSSCCSSARALRVIAPRALVQQFSYLGLGPAGRPLPQGPAAGNLPLPELGNRIAAQVWRLHRETGRPVDIVAESEGTLGVDAMLARHPHVPLGSVVLLSPIVAPGQASYPAGDGDGPGFAGGYALRGVVWFVGGLSPFGHRGAQTLINSVNEVGARFAATAARHHPLRWILLVPLADAVTLPVCELPANVVVVPAMHGDLLGNAAVQQMVRRFLANRQVRAQDNLRTAAQLVAAAAAAWRMPEPQAPSPPCGGR